MDKKRWTMPMWCAYLTTQTRWQRGLFIIETQVPARYREAVKNHYRTICKLRRKAGII